MHLNPHAKCRYSKFNLKLLKKKKNGGHLNPGNTIILQTILSVYVKSIDPDQDQHFVGSDLDPTCLQKLNDQTGGKSCH